MRAHPLPFPFGTCSACIRRFNSAFTYLIYIRDVLDGNEVGWSRRKSTREAKNSPDLHGSFSFLVPTSETSPKANKYFYRRRQDVIFSSFSYRFPASPVGLPSPTSPFPSSLPTFDLNSSSSLTIAWRDLPCAFSGMEFGYPYLSPVGPCVFSLLPLPADACCGQQETRGPCKCLMIIAEQWLL